MNLHQKITNMQLQDKKMAIVWLGQSGFIIKTSHGKVIAIDPYLTDSCERLVGFMRFTPKLISPEEIEADYVLFSHHHEDHFDVDAVPILSSCSKTIFVGSKASIKKCMDLHITEKRLFALSAGDELQFDNLYLKAVYADHGDLVPDAIGFLLEIEGKKLYFAGDTAYRPDKLKAVIDFKPEIAILPINGAYGNLNAIEAAQMAKQLCVRYVIPCHFWTFKEHYAENGDPFTFSKEMQIYAPECHPIFLPQGGTFFY